eukprot:TRINITY_DN41358_c2_g1_i1.p1 TRINITY_DN41358_c2_g1~~TRINITY_DN41358_c2_g1_i1.p1  ORF type:complete len:139 (-),score=0.55 TRINITY_DN41358_c2_g1_i1:233-649(-)
MCFAPISKPGNRQTRRILHHQFIYSKGPTPSHPNEPHNNANIVFDLRLEKYFQSKQVQEKLSSPTTLRACQIVSFHVECVLIEYIGFIAQVVKKIAKTDFQTEMESKNTENEFPAYRRTNSIHGKLKLPSTSFTPLLI